MSQLHLLPDIYGTLRGKVVVLTGGANGIGAATVEALHSHGAHVVFGDLDVKSGEKLVQRLTLIERGGTVEFVETNVTDYAAVLSLFRVASEKHGQIDHALSFAALTEMGHWFDPTLDTETIQEPPTKIVMDVNLLGTLYFAHIAAVYLRHGNSAGIDKSIILMSSVAGFKETPGLYVYQATKHGVLGLMRSLRLVLPSQGIRVNCILPFMTDTIMTSGFSAAWKAAGLPVNTAIHVAHVAMTVAANGNITRKSFYVEGGRAWEIEENIDRLEPMWLGEGPSMRLAQGQAFLGRGMDWAKNEKRDL